MEGPPTELSLPSELQSLSKNSTCLQGFLSDKKLENTLTYSELYSENTLTNQYKPGENRLPLLGTD